MAHKFLDLTFTPKVRAAQERYYGKAQNLPPAGHDDPLGPEETAFIESRDSFYMSSVNETGWPYMQHRGGPKGFLKVIDDRTLAFADYRGNRQYISTGNVAASGRCSLFLMDYPNRARLKIYAQAEIVDLESEPDLADAVAMPGYRAKVERLYRLRLAAFDWNCPQHITPRFTEAEIAQGLQPLRDRLAQLEADNEALRARLAAAR